MSISAAVAAPLAMMDGIAERARSARYGKRAPSGPSAITIVPSICGDGSKPADFIVNYESSGQNISLFVPLTYAYTEPSTHFDFHVAMQGVRLYPDKGTTMTVTVHAPGGNGGT
jgi:hypothetical protein